MPNPLNVRDVTPFKFILKNVDIRTTDLYFTLGFTMRESYTVNADQIDGWDRDIVINDSVFQTQFATLFDELKTAAREIAQPATDDVFRYIQMNPPQKILTILHAAPDSDRDNRDDVLKTFAGAEKFDPILVTYATLIDNTFQAILGLAANYDSFLEQYVESFSV